MANNNFSRAPKQLGDFGEGLVTYDFIRKGYEVAYVDHVGADLICTKNDKRYAVSVKTRLFRSDSIESRMYNIEKTHLEKLEHFSKIFNLEPIFSFLVCLSDSNALYLISIKVSDIKKVFSGTKSGYSIKFGKEEYIEDLKENPLISFSSWENENIGKDVFL